MLGVRDAFAVLVLAKQNGAMMVLVCSIESLLSASSEALSWQRSDQIGAGVVRDLLDGGRPTEDEFSLSF